jgi:rfaE bifunctional protein nucleotidyltransferase chain/domain/rfaE bifunctional protein kinase chain/domain
MRGPLVVVGDALLDIDIAGTSRRLCPDAPVPVIEQAHERPRPGGAGLAALLAAAAGREVVLVTALADDESGRRLRSLLDRHVTLAAFNLRGTTPSKLRIQAGGQSVVRLDVGDGHAVDGPVGPRVSDALGAAAAILVSDYGRGVTGHSAVRRLLTALSGTVPVVWDPHPRGAPPVRGTRVLTPNEYEATELASRTGADIGGAGLEPTVRRARHLAATWELDGVAVTLGAAGALLCNGEPAPFLAPAGREQSGDTCGAGDSFAGAVAGVLADGGGLTEAVSAGVHRASDFIAAGAATGVAARLAADAPAEIAPGRAADVWDVVERTRLAGGKVVATGGCFDLLHAGHVSLIRQARRLGDCLVVCVNSDDSVRRHKGPGRPVTPAADRLRVLEALADVDAAVIFHDDTPGPLLDRLRPDIWVKGADYAAAPLPEAPTVRAYGGEVVLLPFLEGRSTTRLLAAADPTGQDRQDSGITGTTESGTTGSESAAAEEGVAR